MLTRAAMDEGLTTAGVRACVRVCVYACVVFPLDGAPLLRLHQGPKEKRNLLTLVAAGARIQLLTENSQPQGPAAPSPMPMPCLALSTESNHLVSVVEIQISHGRFHISTLLVPFAVLEQSYLLMHTKYSIIHRHLTAAVIVSSGLKGYPTSSHHLPTLPTYLLSTQLCERESERERKQEREQTPPLPASAH
ncbi:hypothetical protein LZ30DRAFT_269388 [Colletotrichum cereale]|nr:hypothetical protein LZ30DRAFT_269388 [Colletotrichum cereale]